METAIPSWLAWLTIAAEISIVLGLVALVACLGAESLRDFLRRWLKPKG